MMRAILVLAVLCVCSSVRAAPRTFTLVSSEISFSIDAPLDTITGSSRGVGGAVTLDPAAWTTAPSGMIEIDLASFRTGIDLRDEDLRDQFFETGKFTSAQLVLNGLERPSAAALTPGTSAEVIIKATLDLHGVKRALDLPARVTFEEGEKGARVKVQADTTIPLEAHAMKRPRRLLFKLGKDVRIHVTATFRAPPVAVATLDDIPDWAKVKLEDVLPPASPVVVAQAPKKKPAPVFSFAATTAEGRGERAAADPKLGGDKNQITCRSCHGVHDERKGIFVGPIVPPSSSLWGSARRASLWQGLAPTPAAAASLCAKLFMLKPAGLDDAVAGDVAAYLTALSPDPTPAHDYASLHRSRASAPSGAGGDVARGKKLVGVYCAACHKDGGVRPALEPGLYERDMLFARVRRAPGADNVQMPPIPIDRLTDRELQDIAAYLADEKQRIFARKPKQENKAP